MKTDTVSEHPLNLEQPETATKPGRHTRLRTWWTSLAVSVVVLLLLMIFILQNSVPVRIHYFGLHATLSFGVAILLSAIAGAILTLLLGTARMMQLNRSKKP